MGNAETKMFLEVKLDCRNAASGSISQPAATHPPCVKEAWTMMADVTKRSSELVWIEQWESSTEMKRIRTVR